MGSILGGPAGQDSSQKLPNWARGVADYLFQGMTPGKWPSQGPFADAIQGWNSAPASQVFGGLADQIGNAQQAGSMGRDLSSQATNQGYNNSMIAAAQGWNPVGQTQQIAGLVPNAMDTANYYLQGVTGASKGNNIMGAMGAGQQVVDQALGAYHALPAEAYQRVVAEGLPEVRASYSARGLGTSGESARGEQDYVQRTRDQLFQQDVANQIAALNAGASASGAAASQAIGAQQSAIQRGQLGLQASQAPGQILGQMQQVASSPMDMLSQFMGLQSAPGQMVSQGMNNYSQGLNLPLEYQQAVYNLTRDGGKSLLASLAGQNQSSSKNDYRGIFGIPKS